MSAHFAALDHEANFSYSSRYTTLVHAHAESQGFYSEEL